MKNLKRTLAGTAIAACIAAILVGCIPGVPEQPIDVAIVVAPVMGGSAPARDAVDSALSELTATGDSYAVVVAEGDPQIVLDATIDALPEYEPTAERTLAAIRDEVAQFTMTRVPTTAEVDLSAAISVAARTFTPGHRHLLIVLSSGLQTTGALSMLDGRLYAESADLVRHAQEQDAIPDLEGVDVRMPQLGVVTPPQESLTDGALQAVHGHWQAYFDAAGAKSLDMTSGSLSPQELSGERPSVTPVPVARIEPASAVDCVQRLEDQSIGFAAGEATLTDPDGVRAMLRAAVTSLASCEGGYRIDASASSEGDPAANKTLTQDRSATILALMEEITGLHDTDFDVHPWGVEWPCRIADIDASGDLILDAAMSNRIVVISKGTEPC